MICSLTTRRRTHNHPTSLARLYAYFNHCGLGCTTLGADEALDILAIQPERTLLVCEPDQTILDHDIAALEITVEKEIARRRGGQVGDGGKLAFHSGGDFHAEQVSPERAQEVSGFPLQHQLVWDV